MCRWISAAVAVVVLSAPASAQANALDLVPDDALGFVLVKDLRQLSDKIEALAKKLEAPERFSLLEKIQIYSGLREGLNEKGSALLIGIAGKSKKDMVEPVLALATSDYAKFARQLGIDAPKEGINQGDAALVGDPLLGLGWFGFGGKEAKPQKDQKKSPVLVAHRDGYVLLAWPERRQALERVLTSRKSMRASLEPVQEWLDAQDVASVCTPRGIQAGGSMLLAMMLGLTYDGLKELADFEKNVKVVAFGGRIEPAGHLRLVSRIDFDPQGAYAKWTTKAQPLEGKLLTQLPEESYALAGAIRFSPEANFGGARLIVDMVVREAPEKVKTSALRLVERISEVGFACYMDKGDKSGAPREVTLLARVDDAAAFVEATVELGKQIQATGKGQDEVSFETVKVAGKPSRLIRTRSKAEKKGDADSSPRPQLNTLLLTEMDAQTVLIALLKSGDQAEAAVKRIADGVARPLPGNKHLQQTAFLLPDKIQIAAYVNIEPLLGSLAVGECSPLGFALRAVPNGIETQLVVPFDLLQTVVKTMRQAKS